MRLATPVIALALAGSGSAAAQCRPPASSNEARLLAFYSVPVVFSIDPAVTAPEHGMVHVAAEAAYVPGASATLQRTGYCYTGRAENTRLTSLFARPRLAFALPGGVGVELSYVPPVTFRHATPDLLSGAVWLTHHVAHDLVATARVHGVTGTVRGPITCPATALQRGDPNGACYGTAQSRDEFHPDMYGGELAISTRPPDASRRWQFTLGAGVNSLHPRFRVGFSDLHGGTDHTQILADLVRYTVLGGATFRLGRTCAASTLAMVSLSDVATAREIVGCDVLRW